MVLVEPPRFATADGVVDLIALHSSAISPSRWPLRNRSPFLNADPLLEPPASGVFGSPPARAQAS